MEAGLDHPVEVQRGVQKHRDEIRKARACLELDLERSLKAIRRASTGPSVIKARLGKIQPWCWMGRELHHKKRKAEGVSDFFASIFFLKSCLRNFRFLRSVAKSGAMQIYMSVKEDILRENLNHGTYTSPWALMKHTQVC